MSGERMPKIDLAQIADPEARRYARMISRPDGSLRASKPRDGEAAYVWRMVAFSISPRRQHQCWPVCAEFYLPTELHSPEHEELRKRLDQVVDAIIQAVPKTEWHGVIRWGEAFGFIGRPQYDENGAVVYRV